MASSRGSGWSRRAIALLDAPSNLGLTPPAPDAVPGVYKLAGALRDQRLLDLDPRGEQAAQLAGALVAGLERRHHNQATSPA